MRFHTQAFALAATALLASTTLSVRSYAAPATSPAPAAAPQAGAAPAQPLNPAAVVATVNGQKITLADMQSALKNLPPQVQQLPQNMVFPMLLNQLADQKAIQIVAKKEGLEKQPDVEKAMQTAAANALQNAWLSQQVTPRLTEANIEAYYQKNYAGKPPEQEVHARHILVKTEAEANDIIKKLKGGADFAQLAAQLSKDTGSAKQNGGDLGWFKKGDMIAPFSNAAFAMKKGEISSVPVKSEYGYHVIQVLDTRTDPIPTLDSVKNKIRQALVQEYVREAVEAATKQVKIVRFDPATGKPLPDAPAPAAAAPAKQ
ncbi:MULTISPECIES: peptidylprolyl isomerase [Acetobacter]|uniref:Parvulin-like PPIase n=1 Tax=Acetobacter thailandicus TaxID=1502842 RepID=A0ABT3QEA7_9PROT|nr:MULTISPECIES: peptidylprolyl isomerase [Acetobacter]MBS0960656.1 peptidylprolyl isomerase [Acetobacter thailandicus]MBS0980271.1 peptidylprolyl isomerase [Acetobacter thailandicus]MBS0986155.1 peptidylprolyl isomerase [Acetobacter thailandicus]MBS1004056.1 peptidylprolyl isomerase [Acetobacter thailandicus]MCX2563606.1 peptidylprolyl isomerase [Acetobacter thailandicus]